MPLPTPYSVICSPIHMRKIVPAVSARTADEADAEAVAAAAGAVAPGMSDVVDVVDDDHGLDERQRDGGERVHWLILRWPARCLPSRRSRAPGPPSPAG